MRTKYYEFNESDLKVANVSKVLYKPHLDTWDTQGHLVPGKTIPGEGAVGCTTIRGYTTTTHVYSEIKRILKIYVS